MAPLNLNMKQVQKLIILAGLGIFLGGCYGGNRGELVGVLDRPNHYQADPYGMNYIHYGSFTMGPGYRSIPYLHDSRPRTVTVGSFYIDREEITNNEYRKFVKWVVDSIAHNMLGEEGIGEHLIEVNEYG